MELLLATSNPHKVDEIRAIFAELDPRADVQLLGLTQVDPHRRLAEPVEDAPTFEGNAIKKARHYHDATGLPCLADDSGLEVDALNGAPGVISARYAGVSGPRTTVDPANNRLLMQNLRDVPAPKRSARFVCTMALVSGISDVGFRISDGQMGRPPSAHPKSEIRNPKSSTPIVVRGTVEGRILTLDEAGPDARGRGINGFGYDPLFLVEDLGKTTAELDAAHKNAISHRGRAARLMWPLLIGLLHA